MKFKMNLFSNNTLGIAGIWVIALVLASGNIKASTAVNPKVQPGEADKIAIGNLLDGLHQAAASADAEDYFGRYTEDAYFLGTDASERWSIDEFKAYADKPFSEGRGWRYEVVRRQLLPTSSPHVYGFDEVLNNAKLGLCRGSGIVIHDGKRWLVAHYVLSMLIPNAIAETVGQASIRNLGQQP